MRPLDSDQLLRHDHAEPEREERLPAPRGPVQLLQRGLGNGRLLQLRRLLQRRRQDGLGDERAGAAEAAEPSLTVPAGRPLPPALRGRAEAQLGASLDGVSLVERADHLCGPIGAEDFTTPDAGGHAVVMSSGVDLGSRAGQETLFHELAHVAQQQRGEAAGLDGLGGDDGCRARLESDADRHAAEILAEGGR